MHTFNASADTNIPKTAMKTKLESLSLLNERGGGLENKKKRPKTVNI